MEYNPFFDLSNVKYLPLFDLNRIYIFLLVSKWNKIKGLLINSFIKKTCVQISKPIQHLINLNDENLNIDMNFSSDYIDKLWFGSIWNISSTVYYTEDSTELQLWKILKCFHFSARNRKLVKPYFMILSNIKVQFYFIRIWTIKYPSTETELYPGVNMSSWEYFITESVEGIHINMKER